MLQVRGGSFSAPIPRGGRSDSPTRLERSSQMLARAQATLPSAGWTANSLSPSRIAPADPQPVLPGAASLPAQLGVVLPARTIVTPAAATPPAIPAITRKSAPLHHTTDNPQVVDEVWMSDSDDDDIQLICEKPTASQTELQQTIYTLQRLHLERTREKNKVETDLGVRIATLEDSHKRLLDEIQVKHGVNRDLERRLLQLQPLVGRYIRMFNFLKGSHHLFVNSADDRQRLTTELRSVRGQLSEQHVLLAGAELERVRMSVALGELTIKDIQLKIVSATARQARTKNDMTWQAEETRLESLQGKLIAASGHYKRQQSHLAKSSKNYKRAAAAHQSSSATPAEPGIANPLHVSSTEGGLGQAGWTRELQFLLSPLSIPGGPLDFSMVPSEVGLLVGDEIQVEAGQGGDGLALSAGEADSAGQPERADVADEQLPVGAGAAVPVMEDNMVGNPSSPGSGLTPPPTTWSAGEVPILPVLLPRRR